MSSIGYDQYGRGYVSLTQADLDAIARVAMSEVGHFGGAYGINELNRAVAGVVDTVVNRLADGSWGDTVMDVLEAPSQFSAVSGAPNAAGSVAALPPTSPEVQAAVQTHLLDRYLGVPSIVADSMYFSNPPASTSAHTYEEVVNQFGDPGHRAGYHVHGTRTGAERAPLNVGVGFDGQLSAVGQQHGSLAWSPESRPSMRPNYTEQVIGSIAQSPEARPSLEALAGLGVPGVPEGVYPAGSFAESLPAAPVGPVEGFDLGPPVGPATASAGAYPPASAEGMFPAMQGPPPGAEAMPGLSAMPMSEQNPFGPDAVYDQSLYGFDPFSPEAVASLSAPPMAEGYVPGASLPSLAAPQSLASVGIGPPSPEAILGASLSPLGAPPAEAMTPTQVTVAPEYADNISQSIPEASVTAELSPVGLGAPLSSLPSPAPLSGYSMASPDERIDQAFAGLGGIPGGFFPSADYLSAPAPAAPAPAEMPPGEGAPSTSMMAGAYDPLSSVVAPQSSMTTFAPPSAPLPSESLPMPGVMTPGFGFAGSPEAMPSITAPPSTFSTVTDPLATIPSAPPPTAAPAPPMAGGIPSGLTAPPSSLPAPAPAMPAPSPAPMPVQAPPPTMAPPSIPTVAAPAPAPVAEDQAKAVGFGALDAPPSTLGPKPAIGLGAPLGTQDLLGAGMGAVFGGPMGALAGALGPRLIGSLRNAMSGSGGFGGFGGGGPVGAALAAGFSGGSFNPGSFWGSFYSQPGSSYGPNVAQASYAAAQAAGMGGYGGMSDSDGMSQDAHDATGGFGPGGLW